jgi:hypothetical protein
MPLRTAAETRALCYKTIGVDPNEVAQFPRLSYTVKAFGGKSSVLEHLRSSSSITARRFIEVYDDIMLPAIVRRTLSLEAFCVAAKVTSEQFRFALSQAALEKSQFEGSIKAATVHPAIVAKSSELALEGDIDHVTLNMKHMGFLPLPKGSQVSVNVNANANANAAAQSATVVAPSPENTIRGLVNRFNLTPKTQQLLPDAKEVVPLDMGRVAESEYVESEEDSFTAQDTWSDE